MKGINIVPIAGLCNRLQAVESALRLAQACELPLNVFWYSDYLHNSSFSNLFVRPPEFHWLVESSVMNPVGRGIKSLFERVLKYTSSLHIPPERRPRLVPLQEVVSHQSVWIESYLPFFNDTPKYDFLKPVPTIQQAIDRVCHSFKERVVGVHVRRTDNQDAKDKSPTHAFLRAMEEEIGRDSRTQFFLSTDSPEEEKRLTNAFKERIITYTKRTLSRARKTGIQDAVTDLFCLSKTEKIVGSHGSSFTETASRISGIPLVIAHD